MMTASSRWTWILLFVLTLAACEAESDGWAEGDDGAPLAVEESELVVAAAPVVVSASNHSCALKDGGVKCWGYNNYGQLGIGTTQPAGCTWSAQSGRVDHCSEPVTPLGLGSGVKGLSAGAHFTCALLSGGTVRCWGRDDLGQLGLGTNAPANCTWEGPMSICTTPMDVPNLANVKTIAGGWFHTCVTLTDGTARCWGSDVRGQLGNGADLPWGCEPNEGFPYCAVPVVVQGLSGAKQLSCGGAHTCAIRTDGSLWCWGEHYYGQLGIGWATPAGCELWGGARADYCTIPIQVPGMNPANTVAAGGNHTCVTVGTNNDAWCFGLNYDWAMFVNGLGRNYGALGIGKTVPLGCMDGSEADGIANWCISPVNVAGANGATSVAGGYSHTCFRLPNGTLKCSGPHFAGRLGAGPGKPAGCDGTFPTVWCAAPVPVQNLATPANNSAAELGGCSFESTGGALKCWGVFRLLGAGTVLPSECVTGGSAPYCPVAIRVKGY